MKELLSARAAADIIGVSPQMVRERIKRGIWTFGEYLPKDKTGRKVDTYIIKRQALEKFLQN